MLTVKERERKEKSVCCSIPVKSGSFYTQHDNY